MKLNTLYKRAVTGKILEHTIEVVDNTYRTISGQTDGVKTTTEWTTCQGKNIGRSNETTPQEQAMAEAKATWKKKIEKGYFENIKKIDTSELFKPMLATKWEDRKDKVSYPLFSQPKLDGIRCIVKSDGMWTRTGKPILSAPHIFDSVKHLFSENPELIFDGELYCDKYANDFNAIVSLVKKTKPSAEDLAESAKIIEYHIYDLPSNEGQFVDRSAELASYRLPKCCVFVETNIIEDVDDILMLFQNYIGAGYEGQMIRTNGYYENKRSNNLIKDKTFTDEEYKIIGVVEGGGNLAGKVGALLFANPAGNEFTASVNGGWEYLEDLWHDRKRLIGLQATVKYFNITPDGVPRFPKVVAIRDYE